MWLQNERSTSRTSKVLPMPDRLPALTLVEALEYGVPTRIILSDAEWVNLACIPEYIARYLLIRATSSVVLKRHDISHLTAAERAQIAHDIEQRLAVAGLCVMYNTTPQGDWLMSVIEAPETPVALPEMDLSVDRNVWPDIIRKTTGHMLAYGWPGTGKSHTFSEIAAEFATNKLSALQAAGDLRTFEHEEVNCTRQTSAAAWLGHWVEALVTKADGSEDRAFVWNDGPVARAMKHGVPIVINDVHLCSDDLFDLLFFVLDTRPGAKYSLPNGTHLKAAPGFRAFLSMNGDPAQVLDEPIIDRLMVKFAINTPSEEALKTIDKDVRGLCRHMYKTAGPGGPKFTFRTFQHFCAIRREYGDAYVAARLVCDTEDRTRAFLEPILIGMAQKGKAG